MDFIYWSLFIVSYSATMKVIWLKWGKSGVLFTPVTLPLSDRSSPWIDRLVSFRPFLYQPETQSKKTGSPVWCQDTCNSISTKPNLTETKIKPPHRGGAFPSSFTDFDHHPASSNAAGQSDGFIDSLRIKTPDQQEYDSVLLVSEPLPGRSWSLWKGDFPLDFEGIFILCLVAFITSSSFNAFNCDVMWTYLCCVGYMFTLCSLSRVILATWISPEIEPMTFMCRHDGTKAERRRSLCRRTLS